MNNTRIMTYKPCPKHPELLLPVATGDSSQHLCPYCGQDARRETYAEQKANPTGGLMRIPRPPPVRF